VPEDPILPIDDPLLSQPSRRIEAVDADIRHLAAEMFAIMDRKQGVGLAAVQIGKPLSLVVLDMPDASERRHRIAMVNPEIASRSTETVVGEESCLSMPGYGIPVPRHREVSVRYLDLEGVSHLLHATGPLAICVQHEVDHVEGVLFFDRVSRLRRQRARDYFRKVRRKYEARAN